MGFIFYYKKNNTKFACELQDVSKEQIMPVLSNITTFLVHQIYSYLDQQILTQIDEYINKLSNVNDINKFKVSAFACDSSQKKMYENYFVINAIKKFGYLVYPYYNIKPQYNKEHFTSPNFSGDRVTLICDTDFWRIVKKHKFKDEDKAIPMFALSSITYSIDKKLFEILSEKYSIPAFKIKRNLKVFTENLLKAPIKSVEREIYVNLLLKSCYQPFITPEMIYKSVPKHIRAVLKLPKKRGKHK